MKCRVRENWQSGPSGKVAALDTPRTRAHAGTGCRCVNRIMSVLCRYKCPWCPRSVRRTWGWERQLGGSAAQWRGRAIGGRDVTAPSACYMICADQHTRAAHPWEASPSALAHADIIFEHRAAASSQVPSEVDRPVPTVPRGGARA